ncbi:hypothetical protein MMC20_004857 [Loxospora ochrophaea]|nr:hypothetical protein [Loxospora ochrophaea]
MTRSSVSLASEKAPEKLKDKGRVNSDKSEKVAVLDTKNHRLSTLPKGDAESLGESSYTKVTLPRWKSKKNVYINNESSKTKDYVATVHLNRLSFAYNVQRLFGNAKDLYVLHYTQSTAPLQSRA